MKARISLWIVVVLIGILAAMVIGAFWQYIVFAALFAVIFFSNYKNLSKRINPNAAAFIVVLSVLVLLVGPTFYVLTTTIAQAPVAYQGALDSLENPSVHNLLGFTADDVHVFAVSVGDKLKNNVIANATSYLTQISNVILGLFVLFITLFFLLRDGEKIRAYFIANLPVPKKEAELFFSKMNSIIRAVLLGQVVTAIIQGVLAGVLFWILGVPSPIFWGVITMLLSIIPMLGPFLVYLPATVYLVLQDHYVRAIIMLLFGVLILSQIDNVIRPLIASKTSKVHPLIVILGVIGGLKLWGLPGFVIGPLILAGFSVLYEFAVQKLETK